MWIGGGGGEGEGTGEGSLVALGHSSLELVVGGGQACDNVLSDTNCSCIGLKASTV